MTQSTLESLRAAENEPAMLDESNIDELKDKQSTSFLRRPGHHTARNSVTERTSANCPPHHRDCALFIFFYI